MRQRHRPSHELYLQHFPSAVELLQGSGVLHGQMDVGDCQLMGQIVDVLHALLHLGQLLLKQLREKAVRAGTPGEKDRGDQKNKCNTLLPKP